MPVLSALNRPFIPFLCVMTLSAAVASPQGIQPVRSSPPCSGGTLFIEPSPNPQAAEVVRLLDVAALSPREIWAVGFWRDLPPFPLETQEHPIAMRYDGRGWTIIPTPDPVNAVGDHDSCLVAIDAISEHEAYAAGTTQTAINVTDNFALRWDGNTWTQLPIPTAPGGGGDRLEAVEAVGPSDVWFAGQFPGHSIGQASAFHWDGSGFDQYVLPMSPLVPNGAHRVRALAAIATDDAWAVGGAGGIGSATGKSYTAHWNGQTWTHVPTPHFGFDEVLNDVAAVASDDVWAVGSMSTSQGFEPLFLHWDGSTWTRVPSPEFGYKLTALASDDVWSVNGERLLRWDGTAWKLVTASRFIHRFYAIDALGPCDLVIAGAHYLSTDDNASLIARFVSTE